MRRWMLLRPALRCFRFRVRLALWVCRWIRLFRLLLLFRWFGRAIIFILSGAALPGRAIKDGVSEELLGGPGRSVAAEVRVKPFEVRRVVERHLVPVGPVACVRVDEKL